MAASRRHGGIDGMRDAATSNPTILGGGPAGIGVAYYAHRAGIPFTLYERASSFGGLCRTFRCGGHRYDSGAHRFHDRDREVTADVRALLGDELVRVSAPSQIYDRGRFVDFPPTPLGLVLSAGLREAGRLGVEILGARLRRTPRCETFEDFAVSQFGPSLARRFLLDYSEKLWGLPASQLSPDVATRRLHGMNVRSLLTEMFARAKGAAHRRRFPYPRRLRADRRPARREIRERRPPGAEVTSPGEGRLRAPVRRRRRRSTRVGASSTLPLTLVDRAMQPDGCARRPRRFASATSGCFPLWRSHGCRTTRRSTSPTRRSVSRGSTSPEIARGDGAGR
jgi:hypothetical protein